MSLRNGLLIICFLIIFCACKPQAAEEKSLTDTPYDEIQRGVPLQGKLFGDDWKFATGRASRNVQNNNLYTIDLWRRGDISAPCSITNPPDRRILFLVPNETGRIFLGLQNTVTFKDRGTSYKAEDGIIDILKVESTHIYGKMYARHDGSNSVKGYFNIVKCN